MSGGELTNESFGVLYVLRADYHEVDDVLGPRGRTKTGSLHHFSLRFFQIRFLTVEHASVSILAVPCMYYISLPLNNDRFPFPPSPLRYTMYRFLIITHGGDMS